MAALSDATLAAISRLAVGTPVTDASDFTALTPAEVAAKFELASYGGDGTLYALGSDDDYDAIDHDDPPVTDLGLWPVGSTTQNVYDNLFAGAVTGTIGSGGALPSGWYNGYTPRGLSVDVVAGGTAFGLPTLQLRVYGTGSDVNSAFVGITADATPAVAGSKFQVSRKMRLVAGSLPDGFEDYLYWLDAGLEYISAEHIAIAVTAWSDESTTITAPANSAFLINRDLHFNTAVGVAVDFTIEICAMSLVTPQSPVLVTTAGAATATHLAAITQREVAVWKPFVVVIEATTGEDQASWPVLYQLSKDASNSLLVVQHPNGNIGVIYYSEGGSDSVYSSVVPDNTPFKLVINVTATKIRAVLTVDSVQEALTLDVVRYGGVSILETVGCNYGGAQQWNAPIKSCTLIHPAVWTDIELEAA